MIKITKDELIYLLKEGVPWGSNGLSHTHTKHHSYYLAETKGNKELLEEYRNSRKES